MPVSAGIVRSYVPGEDDRGRRRRDRATWSSDDLRVTLDYLGEDTLDADQADATVQAYLDALDGALGARPDPSRRGLGEAVRDRPGASPQQGHKIALENARTICRAARNAGTTVTLDMEDHTTTDATLATLRELRKDFPETGAVLQAYLHRTEADCRALAYEGSRVRLCKGAYDEPEDGRLPEPARRRQVLRPLPQGAAGRPGLPDDRDPRPADDHASPRRWPAATAARPAATSSRCSTASGPTEQRRLAEAGETVRVYIPYGTEWYGYLMRRLAERPQNLTFFVRSLISKK